MRTVAALYVQRNGCYWGQADIDAWDESRDARLYAGAHPVVAHPPCHLWVNLAHVNYKRWGGEHNRPGNDGGCFAAALASVRSWGGVLEHPAFSRAWPVHGLARPRGLGWERTVDGGWVCEVWQSAYGHPARKRTWLYASGNRPPDLDWTRRPGTHQLGFFDPKKPTIRGRKASATPPAFRDALLNIARNSK